MKKHCLYFKTIEKSDYILKINKTYIFIQPIAILIALIPLHLCFSSFVVSKANAEEPSTTSLDREINKSTQILLVTNYSLLFYSETNVYALEKRDGKWKTVLGPFDAVAGRNGFALQGEKREGDGKDSIRYFPSATDIWL